MRNFLLQSPMLTVLLVFVSSMTYGQQVEKTLVKSFNLEGNQQVALQMDGPIEVRTWNNNFLRVQMQVTLREGSEALLKSLVQAGRYNLRHEIEEETQNEDEHHGEQQRARGPARHGLKDFCNSLLTAQPDKDQREHAGGKNGGEDHRCHGEG